MLYYIVDLQHSPTLLAVAYVSTGLTSRKRELSDIRREAVTLGGREEGEPPWREEVRTGRDDDVLHIYMDWPYPSDR